MSETCGECRNFKNGKCYAHHVPVPADHSCFWYFSRKQTNGDKIRKMSNEELAELFALCCMCDTCPLKDVECVGDGETARTYAHCHDKFNAYLNAPAESGEGRG
jgi:hypothetical protein